MNFIGNTGFDPPEVNYDIHREQVTLVMTFDGIKLFHFTDSAFNQC